MSTHAHFAVFLHLVEGTCLLLQRAVVSLVGHFNVFVLKRVSCLVLGCLVCLEQVLEQQPCLHL